MNGHADRSDTRGDPPRNIEFSGLPELSWDDGRRGESVQKVADYVAGEARTAIDWYLRKKAAKRYWAQLMRALAIVATALAGLIPLLAGIFTTAGTPDIAPAWASVALVVAATCVGLDRFFGFSSAWMRFLATEMKIRQALHAFLLDWERRRAAWGGAADPEPAEIEAALGRCKEFIVQVNGILKSEMDAWITEFSAALADIDRAAKAQAETLQLGAANVTVSNGDRCEDGWQMSIDGGAKESHRGTSVALRNLVPGSHTVAVTGRIDGQTRQAERAFTVAAGQTASAALTLE